MTPTEKLTKHVIDRCNHALASHNPRHLTAAITYAITWSQELHSDSEASCARWAELGKILGAWYGGLSQQEESPDLMRLEELARRVRSDHDDILALERGETGAE